VLFEVFLLNKVSFESVTSLKDPCITREKFLGIHDLVNDQGFAMHYRAISYTVSRLYCKFSENQYYSKAKGQTDFSSSVECFRSKDLSM